MASWRVSAACAAVGALAILWTSVAQAQLWVRAARVWIPAAPTQIASQATPVVEGVVLLEQPVLSLPSVELSEASQGRVKVPAGTRLFNVTAAGASVFCTPKMFKNSNLLGREQVCFHDSKDSGTFDRLLRTISAGVVGGSYDSVSAVGRAEAMQPVRYRKAELASEEARVVSVAVSAVQLNRRRVTLEAYSSNADEPRKANVQKVVVSIDQSPTFAELAGAKVEITAASGGGYNARVIEALDPTGIVFGTVIKERRIIF